MVPQAPVRGRRGEIFVERGEQSTSQGTRARSRPNTGAANVFETPGDSNEPRTSHLDTVESLRTYEDMFSNAMLDTDLQTPRNDY